MANKLLKKIEITGSIKLLTGLHIGGANTSMNIGGIDKSVIRNPLNNQPFIPGSSLKGKMRSLLQVSRGEVQSLDRPMGGQVKNVSTKDKADAQIFGNSSGDDNQKPSRIIIRDCNLLNADELLKHTEIPYTEGKTEVVIDRITSAASPRQIERVPAGAEFSLNMVLNIWEQDANEKQLMEYLFASLQLLKDDYLGGSGSRGYGQVEINIEEILEKTTIEYYGKPDGLAKSIKSNWQNEIEKLKN